MFTVLHGSFALELLRENLDYAVIGVLGFMSFLMLWLVIERYLYFARVDLARLGQCPQCTAPMADLVLLGAHLGKSPAVNGKHRVVAEPTTPPPPNGDPAINESIADDLRVAVDECHCSPEPGSPIFDPPKVSQQTVNIVVVGCLRSGKAGGVYPGLSV